MKTQTILLLIGTATALVPRNKETSEVANNVFASPTCHKWGQCCPPTCGQSCCPDLKCKFQLDPATPGSNSYEGICKIK
ncbi:hypothetical protein Vi05172_g4171 [Venturia inaequalis]|nr:hypothetical protein Vi05172_g4171 [Venturia inaequalis]